jgi:hypothetical protein
MSASLPGLPNARERRSIDPTSLWKACSANNINEVMNLVNAGADVQMSDYNSRSPLWIAAYKGYPRVVKFLLENGADVDAGDIWEERSPLFISTSQHHLNIMTILLDHGANPNLRNREHVSPLSAAVYGGDFDAVNLLLLRGATLGVDGTGFSQVFIAKKYGYKDILEILSVAEQKQNKRANIAKQSRRSTKSSHGTRRGGALVKTPSAKLTLKEEGEDSDDGFSYDVSPAGSRKPSMVDDCLPGEMLATRARRSSSSTSLNSPETSRRRSSVRLSTSGLNSLQEFAAKNAPKEL